MTHPNTVAHIPASQSIGNTGLLAGEHAEAQFCDGGVAMIGIDDRNCWRCGAPPNGDCRAELSPMSFV